MWLIGSKASVTSFPYRCRVPYWPAATGPYRGTSRPDHERGPNAASEITSWIPAIQVSMGRPTSIGTTAVLGDQLSNPFRSSCF